MANVNVLTKLSLSTVGAAVIALGAAGTAQATTFTEVGDAGQTLNTAQNLPGGINVIQGTISPSDDADLFSFSWGGGQFNATTVGGTPFTFDTLLQLFDSSGTLIAENDDSQLTPQSILNQFVDSGEYLLGISSFANFAESGPTYGSIGPGFSPGSYSISLNQETASVPEPACLIGILGLGAFGINTCRLRGKGEGKRGKKKPLTFSPFPNYELKMHKACSIAFGITSVRKRKQQAAVKA